MLAHLLQITNTCIRLLPIFQGILLCFNTFELLWNIYRNASVMIPSQVWGIKGKLTFILQPFIEITAVLELEKKSSESIYHGMLWKMVAVWHVWFTVSGLKLFYVIQWMDFKLNCDSRLTVTEPRQQWVLFCCWFIDLYEDSFDVLYTV